MKSMRFLLLISMLDPVINFSFPHYLLFLSRTNTPITTKTSEIKIAFASPIGVNKPKSNTMKAMTNSMKPIII